MLTTRLSHRRAHAVLGDRAWLLTEMCWRSEAKSWARNISTSSGREFRLARALKTRRLCPRSTAFLPQHLEATLQAAITRDRPLPGTTHLARVDLLEVLDSRSRAKGPPEPPLASRPCLAPLLRPPVPRTGARPQPAPPCRRASTQQLPAPPRRRTSSHKSRRPGRRPSRRHVCGSHRAVTCPGLRAKQTTPVASRCSHSTTPQAPTAVLREFAPPPTGVLSATTSSPWDTPQAPTAVLLELASSPPPRPPPSLSPLTAVLSAPATSPPSTCLRPKRQTAVRSAIGWRHPRPCPRQTAVLTVLPQPRLGCPQSVCASVGSPCLRTARRRAACRTRRCSTLRCGPASSKHPPSPKALRLHSSPAYQLRLPTEVLSSLWTHGNLGPR
mmetsp:Transcript_2952/g.7202  ORF Transcript_2952/g.7202 Transcript_2952/m.7202 type:complete len:385 (+) Transcript_2952:111-1265(+)